MTGSREVTSRGADETAAIGRRLGDRLQGGEVVLLFGPLGAGKTVFVQGLAAGLGIDPTAVRSPSYTLIDEHHGRLVLYHVDLYRLSGEALPELGLEDLYADDTVVAVEWAERLEEAGWDLGDSILVEIDHSPGDEDTRLLAIDPASALPDS